MVAWVSSPRSMRTGGAPISPSASTSQPTFASTAFRAAPTHVKLAMVAPVTKPTVHSGGRRRISSSHRAATVSAAADAGEQTGLAPFWPQALVSMSAATPTGCEAPITQPKKRRPADPDNPGSAAAARASITSRPSCPCSGVGPSSRA
jgi:hypothetical protein